MSQISYGIFILGLKMCLICMGHGRDHLASGVWVGERNVLLVLKRVWQCAL